MTRASVFKRVALLTICIGILPAGARAAEKPDAKSGDTPTLTLSANPRTRLNSRLALPARVEKDYYCVLHAEFQNEKSRATFEQHLPPGVTVYSSFERFADIFVAGKPIGDGGEDQGIGCDDAALRTFRQSPGYRWDDDALVIAVPPPPSGDARRPGMACRVFGV